MKGLKVGSLRNKSDSLGMTHSVSSKTSSGGLAKLSICPTSRRLSGEICRNGRTHDDFVVGARPERGNISIPAEGRGAASHPSSREQSAQPPRHHRCVADAPEQVACKINSSPSAPAQNFKARSLTTCGASKIDHCCFARRAIKLIAEDRVRLLETSVMGFLFLRIRQLINPSFLLLAVRSRRHVDFHAIYCAIITFNLPKTFYLSVAYFRWKDLLALLGLPKKDAYF